MLSLLQVSYLKDAKERMRSSNSLETWFLSLSHAARCASIILLGDF